MRKVMEDDLTAFRKMVTKVYENMTQDVSDVLVNEQIQTTNFYQERYDMFNNKMLWMISEIFQMVPDFDFEKYGKDKDDFLNNICPIPALVISYITYSFLSFFEIDRVSKFYLNHWRGFLKAENDFIEEHFCLFCQL